MNTKFLPGIMMLALSIITIALIITGFAKALKKTNYGYAQQKSTIIVIVSVIAAWMTLIGVLAENGFFSNFSALPPRPAFAVLIPLPFILFIAFSKKLAPVLKAVPPHWIIAMQAFRIVVELLLFTAYNAGLLPKQMTFEGGNFDILSGILAILLAFVLSKKYNPLLVKLYNIVGIVLLLNILVITVLSMPTKLQVFMNKPASTIVTEFPFIYLPGVLVVTAYSLHIFSLRQIAVLKQQIKVPRSII